MPSRSARPSAVPAMCFHLLTMTLSVIDVPAQPVDATPALNLSAGVSNPKVSRGRSLS